VQDSLGPNCSAQVRRATDIITNMLQNSTGREQLQQLFTTCDPIVSDNDVATFMSSLSEGICGVVQYNNDNNNYNPFNIDMMCSILTGTTDNEVLQSFINLTNIFNAFYGENCTETSYDEMIEEMQDVDPTSDVVAARSWTWQTCTEYGYFQTGDASDQPFSNTITLEYFLQQCNDIFGFPFTPNIAATIANFGGKNLTETRVVLPNGSIDPWHILGITTEPLKCDQKDVAVRFMTGTAHCADLYPPTPNDLPDLTNTRKVELEHISKWVSSEC